MNARNRDIRKLTNYQQLLGIIQYAIEVPDGPLSGLYENTNVPMLCREFTNCLRQARREIRSIRHRIHLSNQQRPEEELAVRDLILELQTEIMEMQAIQLMFRFECILYRGGL